MRVNAIAPGNIHSPMNEEYFRSPEYERSMIDLTPAGRVGVVEDIAPAVVFLASEAARYVHGVSLLVDGGWAPDASAPRTTAERVRARRGSPK